MAGQNPKIGKVDIFGLLKYLRKKDTQIVVAYVFVEFIGQVECERKKFTGGGDSCITMTRSPW